MTTPAPMPIESYWERCKSLVLSQYDKAPRLLGLLEAGCNRSDDTEAVLWEILDAFKLDTAAGVQLDVVGAKFRESRLGRTDADYREAIHVKASLAVNGTPEQIMEFLRNAFPGLSDIEYQPEYPAGFALLTDDTTSGANMLRMLAPAGVSAVYGEPVIDGAGDIVRDGNGQPLYSARA